MRSHLIIHKICALAHYSSVMISSHTTSCLRDACLPCTCSFGPRPIIAFCQWDTFDIDVHLVNRHSRTSTPTLLTSNSHSPSQLPLRHLHRTTPISQYRIPSFKPTTHPPHLSSSRRDPLPRKRLLHKPPLPRLRPPNPITLHAPMPLPLPHRRPRRNPQRQRQTRHRARSLHPHAHPPQRRQGHHHRRRLSRIGPPDDVL